MNPNENRRNKALVSEHWERLESRSGDARRPQRSSLSESHRFRGPVPIGDLDGRDDYFARYWNPLRSAFRHLTRETHLLIGGPSNGRADGTGDGRAWVGGTGLLHGYFACDYLSIPASKSDVTLRWGEFCEIEDGHISRTLLLLDIVDLIEQAGIDVLPPARGRPGLWPPPAAADGIISATSDKAESDYSLEHIRRFIFDGLNNYDQASLGSMGMADYFDPDVRWYGPAGIGACFSFDEFEALHQRHWLHAFPDRQVQNLDALIADGAYTGAPGWGGVIATHSGEYLGVAPSGRRIAVNGVDFWKRSGERYIENWVFVDMVHLFAQFGVDLLARMRARL